MTLFEWAVVAIGISATVSVLIILVGSCFLVREMSKWK